MAIPPTAIIWDEVMDPYDVLDYTIDMSSILQAGESIASYTINVPAESLLLGLSTSTYPSTIASNVITVWLSIDPSKQKDAVYDGIGTNLPLEVNITTTSNPPRKRQRTVVLKVAQR